MQGCFCDRNQKVFFFLRFTGSTSYKVQQLLTAARDEGLMKILYCSLATASPDTFSETIFVCFEKKQKKIFAFMQLHNRNFITAVITCSWKDGSMF